MSDFFKLQFLAILQGITEFLPVSSSAHLALLKDWMGLEVPGKGPLLEILLHGGTLVAVFLFYRKTILMTLKGIFKGDADALNYALLIILACLPPALLYFCAHDFLEEAFQNPRLIGCCLLVTGGLLYSIRALKVRPGADPSWRQALGIGIAQAFAILPGISRSGSTYVVARWLKVPSQNAFDFSFLISIPLVLGSILLKVRDFSQLAGSGCSVFGLACAFCLSAIVGLASLKLLSFLRTLGSLWLFAPYCIVLGVLALIFA